MSVKVMKIQELENNESGEQVLKSDTKKPQKQAAIKTYTCK